MHIINFLKNFLSSYWLDIFIIIAFLGLLAWLLKKGKKDLVKRIIYSLVVKAEKELGSKTGEAKYNQVISELYNRLPFIIRILYNKDEIDIYIKDAVEWLKYKLQDPEVNLLGYTQEVGLQKMLETPTYQDKNEPLE